MQLLTNTDARRHFLHLHGLSGAPTGPGKGPHLENLIGELGFVQLDSVNTVARAHDMILWSRCHGYRPKALGHLLARDRALFEHWTHDASVLPIGHFPHWRLRFDRSRERLKTRWTEWQNHDFQAQIDEVRRQITDHGACGSGDVGGDEARSSGGWWEWHPSKTALEYLWRTGEISVVRRDAFRKIYDLTERVIPAPLRDARIAPHDTIDWACREALRRLGFATSGEIAAFWDLATAAEARDWCAARRAAGEIEEVNVEMADGNPRRHFAFPGLVDAATDSPDPGPRVRILSPFDPALRDRKRAERLLGFHYRIEIFVPEAQRRYGYYVFPVIEGTRMIGRIDMKADRSASCMTIAGFWPEPGVPMGAGRRARLERAIARTADFAACDTIAYAPGWLRESLG